MSLFEPIFEALNGAGVRYIVVGGLATVLHGHARLTADIDLIVDLTPEEALRAIKTLTRIGFQPRIPVAATDFAIEAKRREWIRDKNMRVFPLVDPGDPMRQIDLFADTPIDFDSLWARSEVMQLERTTIRVAAIEDLIGLKRLAARPQDLADIEALEAILAKKRKP
jgi:hypothetical protein